MIRQPIRDLVRGDAKIRGKLRSLSFCAVWLVQRGYPRLELELCFWCERWPARTAAVSFTQQELTLSLNERASSLVDFCRPRTGQLSP